MKVHITEVISDLPIIIQIVFFGLNGQDDLFIVASFPEAVSPSDNVINKFAVIGYPDNDLASSGAS